MLSLCSGGGGLDLGLRLAVPAARVVCHVEIEAYAAAVLAARMDEDLLHPAPLWSDLRTFDGRPWRGRVHCVTAGYPCQPFSVAGKRRAEADERHLWPHVARVVGEVEPDLVFLENVAHHLALGFPEVARDLVGLRYRLAAGLFTAAEVGAPHRRQRLFILAERLADSDDGELPLARRRPAGRGRARPDGEALGDADGARREGRLPRLDRDAGEPPAWPPGPDDRDGWRRWLEREPGTEPALRRGAHGLAAGMVGGAPTNTDRIERLRLLGNGVVPLVAAHAFRALRARLDADAGRRPG
ncbi:DNA cytosine methyltransferase [uncultured Methylobacterium sp.]|uniref:DNA cytosine methyltransferase n=1 Tax=uncultured Methylobacterium sp. TaxID=157278 RepID=UPI0035C95512